MVDKNLLLLIEKGINLTEYFESELSLVRIQNTQYPDLHEDDKEVILKVEGIKHPVQVVDKYQELFKSELDEEKNEEDS